MPIQSLGDRGSYGVEQEKTMFNTYILRCLSHQDQRYIGSTSDLKSRLAKHNAGEVPHTSKFKPWKVEACFAFETKEKAVHPMCDEYIPFWNLVYHGITLYNCYAASVNANIKTDRDLKVMNYALGGRPLSYVNSRFKNDVNNWGDEDLRYHPVEQFRKDVAVIRKDFDFYQSIKDLQYEFIEDYEELADGALKTTYSNGAVMFSNPTEKEIVAEGHTLAPFSNTVFR